MRVDERREGNKLWEGKGRTRGEGIQKRRKKKKNGNDTISRSVIKGRFLPGYEYEHDRRVERLDINVYIYILIL